MSLQSISSVIAAASPNTKDIPQPLSELAELLILRH